MDADELALDQWETDGGYVVYPPEDDQEVELDWRSNLIPVIAGDLAV